MLAYVVAVVVVQLLSFAAVLFSRLLGHDTRTSFDGVGNFRTVDGAVWAGAQPDADAYPELAARGVRLVVDLRTGTSDDPRKDDPGLLRRLGVDHLRLPIPDGHVPSARQVDRFVAAVGGAGGTVFVHCGAGVGRTSALTAAYREAAGTRPPLLDQLAIGAHTLEQVWFLATGDTNSLVRRASEVLDAPRRGWSRLKGFV